MIPKVAAVAAAIAVAAFVALHRPPAPAAIETISLAATPGPSPSVAIGTLDRGRRRMRDDTVVVYVTGAVKRPGIYLLRPGDRYDRAVSLAGGFVAAADLTGVNLAQRAVDGDEIDVPAMGDASPYAARRHAPAARRHARSSRSRTPPSASVDVNDADAQALALVPGIGRAVAARIVELRQREGSFRSLDELLDVAGMTAARLERARPYLREP